MIGGDLPRVVVVLGCRVGRDNVLSAAAQRRVERAAELWHESHAELVVASGGKRWQGVAEAEAMSHQLQQLGVPQEKLAQELESHTTRENAICTRRLLQRLEVDARIALVTCDFHQRRALALFRGVGFDAEGHAARSPSKPLWQLTLRALKEELGLRRDLRRLA